MQMNYRAHSEPFSRSFGTNETQQLREGQLVGRMLLQRLATGATGVKQARHRRKPTRGSETLVGACAVYTQRCVCMCVGCIIPPRVLHFSAIHSTGDSSSNEVVLVYIIVIVSLLLILSLDLNCYPCYIRSESQEVEV